METPSLHSGRKAIIDDVFAYPKKVHASDNELCHVPIQNMI